MLGLAPVPVLPLTTTGVGTFVRWGLPRSLDCARDKFSTALHLNLDQRLARDLRAG
jgi:hypothetical protein